MRGINKVILIGNLGGDPETRYLQSGAQVTNFRLATSESWKDKNTGQKQERTEWHRIACFARLAEIAGEYLRKGSKVYVEGSLRTSEYEKNGEKRYSTEIVAREIQMLDTRGDGAAGAPAQPKQYASNQDAVAAAAGPADYDQDIPFQKHENGWVV